MGLFSKLFGGGKPSQPTPKKKTYEDQPLSWFSTPEAKEVFDLCFDPTNMIKEKNFEKLYDEWERKDEYSYPIYMSVYHKDYLSPKLFVRQFVNAHDCDILDYVGPVDLVTDILLIGLATVIFDENDEPQESVPTMTYEMLIDENQNKLISFVSNFNFFKLEDDGVGSWDNKYEMIKSICFAIEKCIICQIDFNELSFIADKGTYINGFGTLKSLKAFLNGCAEKCTSEVLKQNFLVELNELE